MEKKQNKPQNKPQPQNNSSKTQMIDNYLNQLNGMDVELYVEYGTTVLQLQGKLYSKARFDIILEFVDDKKRLQKLIINKAFIIMAKPLP